MGIGLERVRIAAGAEGAVTGLFALPHGADRCAGILILPDENGIDSRFERIAEELLAEGYAVLVLDVLHPEEEGTSEAGWSRSALISDRRVLGELDSALGWLGGRNEVDAERLAVVGFADGGTYAFLLGCHSTRLAAAVDIHGRIVYPELSGRKPIQPLELALNLSCPLFALFGANDPATPAAHVERMRATLGQFAKHFEIHTQPDAGVDVLDARSASDAWSRAKRFLADELGAPARP